MPAFTAAVTVGTAVSTALSLGVTSTFALGAIGFLTQAAVGLALNALTPKPSSESKQGIGGYRLNGKRSNLDHQVIYGETRVGGAIVFEANSSDIVNAILYRVYVHTGHPIEGYKGVFIGDKEVTQWAEINPNTFGFIQNVSDPSAVPNGTPLIPVVAGGSTIYDPRSTFGFDGGVVFRFYDGTQTTADSYFVSKASGWTSNHVLNNCAYMTAELLHGLGNAWPNGVPEFTCQIRGKKLYDPRSGTTAWSDNPALCLRDYLASDYGLNESSSNIDDILVATAANVCDQTADNGQKRYTCNGAFTTGVTPVDLLSEMLTSMGGLLWYAQGKWRMKPAYYTTPVLDLTEDDLRSSIALKTRHSRRDNFNTVKGTFKGPETKYEFTDYPEVTNAAFLSADGGQESVVDLNLPFTDNSDEARRIARIFLERNRQQLTVSASFGMRAFQVQVGDIIRLTVDRFGWTQKEFEVASWTFGLTDAQDLQVQMTLREISESVFDEVDDGAVYERDNTTLPDPFISVPPKNLTVSDGGFTTEDGTFVNSFIIDWEKPDDGFVKSYVLEWRVQGDSVFKSVKLDTTEYQIAPVQEGLIYDIRVKAINIRNVSGPYATTTATVGGDSVAPGLPTSITATGGFKYITIDWTNPPDADLNYVEIHENSTNTLSGANLVGTTSGSQFVRTNLDISQTKFYFLRAVDYSGNKSGFTSGVSGTTTFIDDADFENGIRTLFEDQGLFPIEDVTSLPASGQTGQKVFNRTDGKLYEWNGSAWVLVVAAVEAPDISGQLATNQIELDAITNDLIANNAVQTENIANLAVNADKIADNAILTTKILDGVITTNKIQLDAITNDLIANNAVQTENIANLAVNADKISNSAITTTKIADAAVQEGKLADGAATEAKIATDAITETKISDGAISTPKLQVGAVTAGTIAAGAVTAGKIAAGSVTASEIAAGTITSNEIATNTITSGNIAAGAITTNELAAGSVTATEIAADTITSNEIATGAITALEIAAGTITSNEIATNTITSSNIATNTITSNEIAAGAITTSELAAGSVTATEIAADSITTSKIAAGAVTALEIAAGTITSNEIATGTITSSEIATNTITAGNIAAGAITTSELAAGAVTATEIAANSIITSKIAAGAVTASEIAAGTITSNEIATNTLTANNIATGTITADEIAGNTITGDKISANTITGGLLATSGIITSSAQIGDALITNAKIGNLAVDTAKIANAAITNAKIDSLDASKITTGELSASRINIDDVTLTASGGSLIVKDAGIGTFKVAPSAVTSSGSSSGSQINFTGTSGSTVLAWATFSNSLPSGQTGVIQLNGSTIGSVAVPGDGQATAFGIGTATSGTNTVSVSGSNAIKLAFLQTKR